VGVFAAEAPLSPLYRFMGTMPPAGSRAEEWDTAVRRVARYRIEHQITDHADPLGPEPHDPHQAREWHRAHESVERAERRLGREHTHDHGLDIGM